MFEQELITAIIRWADEGSIDDHFNINNLDIKTNAYRVGKYYISQEFLDDIVSNVDYYRDLFVKP